MLVFFIGGCISIGCLVGGKRGREAFWKKWKICRDRKLRLCLSFQLSHKWAKSGQKCGCRYKNTEKMTFFKNFFSKNWFFGRISKPVAMKPFFIDRTTSSGQFPCLMTTFDFFNEELQPTKNSLKKVKKFSKKTGQIRKSLKSRSIALKILFRRF